LEHATEMTAGTLESIASRLKEALTETTYETWFGHAGPVSLIDGQLLVEVPNDFTRDWIQGHFYDFVSGAARSLRARRGRFVFGGRCSARSVRAGTA
jgi:chromosomal replication initiation ATPase DnaA